MTRNSIFDDSDMGIASPRPVLPGQQKKIDTPRPASPGAVEPVPYQSPTFDEVEKEFKDQLLSFTTDLLLTDLDLLKNIAERGNKILLHIEQLKQLIAISCLNKEDRGRYNELIEIETEEVQHDCCIKNFTNPCYLKIKNIYLLNRVNFCTTAYAVNMTSTFRISLEHCSKG
jgi:hypothetical protein